MKKLLNILLLILVVHPSFSQEAADKKVQGGLVVGAGLNLIKPETNLISTSGIGSDLIVGMGIDWHFSENIALSTGIEFEFDRFRHTFNDSVYVDYLDKEILVASSSQSAEGLMLLNERQYRSIYATLPIMLKFQTGYLGFMRYFGKFGIRNSFLLKSRGDNYGDLIQMQSLEITNNSELLDMRIPGDLSFYRGSLGISAGAEWNFSGSTCLVSELGYFYGFSNLHNGNALVGDEDKNKSIYRNDISGKNYVLPNAKHGQILLRISLLF